MAIQNIIFDLGGVILNIDYHLTEKAFVDLGCADFHKLYSQAKQIPLFDKFEKGVVTEDDFFAEVAKVTKLSVDKNDLKKAWNAMLISLPKENHELLKELKGKYRLFLLSNTNETHISAFTKIIERTCPMEEFEKCFEEIYYSNVIGLKKPDPDPFVKILRDHRLAPKETLFIDDSIQHVEGARKVGIKAELLEKGKSTRQLLEELKLL